MKKLLILLLASATMFGQNIYVATGFDIRNMVLGSDATQNKPELDLMLKFGMIQDNTEVTVGYERFNSISFDRLLFGVGHQFPLYAYPFGKEIKTLLIPSIEPSLIGRWSNWGGGLGDTTQNSSHLTIGISLALRHEISYRFSVELQSNFLPRTDLNAMYGGNNYVFSNYLNILYRL